MTEEYFKIKDFSAAIGCLPDNVIKNLVDLYEQIQDAGVDGGLTASDRIERLKNYQRNLSNILP